MPLVGQRSRYWTKSRRSPRAAAASGPSSEGNPGPPPAVCPKGGPPAVGDVCGICIEGDSVTTPCVSTKGGPAAWMVVDGLNAVGISTGSDGTELPVVPARSPDRLRSYGRINPPATGTKTTLYGSMV